MSLDLYDVIILCGGPVGLYAAYYAGFRTLRTKIVERLAALGGQIMALYPEKWIYDIAGFPRILGRALIDNLVSCCCWHGPRVAGTRGCGQGKSKEATLPIET
jgi:ferredoxin/flavodoxin---NADP+ reductase